jgi:N-acetylmuramoyl-L-alanine amidase
VILATALACLAMNVYQEARSESIPGQYAVALVTLNRAGGDQAKVCAEVFKPYQFSWTNVGVPRIKGGWVLPAALQPREAHAWWVANRVALMTLTGMMPDFTDGSTFYHEKGVRPAWRLAMQPTKAIGAHRFYALANDSQH